MFRWCNTVIYTPNSSSYLGNDLSTCSAGRFKGVFDITAEIQQDDVQLKVQHEMFEDVIFHDRQSYMTYQHTAIAFSSLWPWDTAFVMATRSAQMQRPYEAFSTLTPTVEKLELR